ncbi:hypothetical protein LCGC14_2836890 [marine sediment metagenome]|uniref:Uncharacterized protein n=1 Tax=marine sediment metagenome TaxID=412755 RepID=A0A0F8YCK0_9ZZZZ
MTMAIAEVAYAWTDPEFYGLEGLGCSRCHDRPPIVWGLGFGGALCVGCLLRCFGGWDFDRLSLWLVRQKQVYLRQCERAEAVRMSRRGFPYLWDNYLEKYGLEQRIP